MLKTIIIVTHLVPSISAIETAYIEHLDYQTVESGKISSDLASLWDAPAMAGQDFLIMKPASNAEVFLRFVKNPTNTSVAPMTTYGWNATELLVTDPDSLAVRLANSPFTMIGPPADLYPSKDAPRAMQVQGPADEVLYLTRIIPAGTRFPLGSADSPVDRVFIVVVGGPSMEKLTAFYGDRLGLPVTEPSAFKISVLSKANRLPKETTYPLAVAQFTEKFLVELDEYPDVTSARPTSTGALPPGMAMVSFDTDNLDKLDLTWRKPPRSIDAFPYNGRRTAVTVGPAGEWLEIIENRE